MGSRARRDAEFSIDPPASALGLDQRIGQVARLVAEKGFGFIRAVDGQALGGTLDYFFHLSDLQDCQFSELWATGGGAPGTLVIFTPEETEKGWRAREVRLVGR